MQPGVEYLHCLPTCLSAEAVDAQTQQAFHVRSDGLYHFERPYVRVDQPLLCLVFLYYGQSPVQQSGRNVILFLILVDQNCFPSLGGSDTSISHSEQLEALIPPSTISDL